MVVFCTFGVGAKSVFGGCILVVAVVVVVVICMVVLGLDGCFSWGVGLDGSG